jgi:hypothetical protein
VSVQFDPADLSRYDIFVFRGRARWLLAALERSAQAGKRTVIDLDEDFLHLPDEHPGSGRYGSPEAQRDLERALARADLVTVPSTGLAERYRALARQVVVLPCAWNQGNALWNKPAPRRQTVNLGVAGTHIHPKDTLSLRNDLARLLRKHPHTLLVAAQDLRLYQAFSAIPEERRLFLPAGRLEDYPYLLANIASCSSRSRTRPHQARSDQPLLGWRPRHPCGLPVPAFKEWEAGGCSPAR